MGSKYNILSVLTVMETLLLLTSCKIPKDNVKSQNIQTTNCQPGESCGENANAGQLIRPCDLIPEIVFGPEKTSHPDWAETVWYEPSDSLGQVLFDKNGIHFKGIQSNLRSGFRKNLGNTNVSECPTLMLRMNLTVEKQTLEGTGIDGREAPVAVAISYTDINDVTHSTLNAYNTGEPDDRKTTRFFWRGFYYAEKGDNKEFGIKVNQNEPFDFAFDLMTLDPKPKLMHYLVIEGSGWKEREGFVSKLSLTGSK
ncbi:MAG: hypothetical protein HQK54_04585 [Oligoflexales bacterium]|nr:hypothetical protein [Oligoflexales bacterium]